MAKNIIQTDYRKMMWDRMENVAYPGEHTNLFGHDGALDKLASAYKSARMHHAWLITGPKGVGKATLALAFAGHIIRNPDPEHSRSTWVNPEADDSVASKIGKGGHPNILHLARPYDPKTKKFKSHLTIDEIRRTVSFFGTTAGEDNWRICIVDSADDMNISAANALLKILEEPPPRTIFFVLSSSPGRLLATIRSRCRQLNLRPLNNENVQCALIELGIDIGGLGETELQILFRLAGGSVRKAITLVRQQGLKIYQRFDAIVDSSHAGRPDWLEIHRLADELSRRNQEDQYRLLFEIVQDHISNMLHQNSQNLSATNAANHQQIQIEQQVAQRELSKLARMCELWEKTAASVSLTDSYNLNRKQVVLNLFGSLAQINGS